jgi:hypothetical protein
MLPCPKTRRIDCPASSQGLAGLALDPRAPRVQSLAIEVLKQRDPRDFLEDLIGLMRRPLKIIRVRPVGPAGQSGFLIVEGARSRTKRVYQVPWVAPARWRGAYSSTQVALSSDIQRIHSFNAQIESSNHAVASVLSQITGKSLGGDPEAWLTWWNDRIGYHYQRYEPPIKWTTRTVVPIRVMSCFAAGTPVWTLTGPQPIESLHIGDLVLSQDTTTGALGYEPVVEMHHNPPDATLRIRLQGETLEPTTYHRFWRPGRGWAMARDLKPGDLIRTVGGRTEVLAVEHGPTQPVFNLDVARNCTFFVGSQKELVHDNSLPPPVLTPFDAEPSLASIGRGPE